MSSRIVSIAANASLRITFCRPASAARSVGRFISTASSAAPLHHCDEFPHLTRSVSQKLVRKIEIEEIVGKSNFAFIPDAPALSRRRC
jgi:hypothetical protein